MTDRSQDEVRDTEVGRSFGDERAFWRAISRLHDGVLQHVDDELRASVGLSAMTLEALYELSEAPGERLQLRQLGRLLGLTPSGATRLVNRLAQEGLVHREATTHDRRAVNATLTPKGKAAFEGARQLYAHSLHHALMRHRSLEDLVVYTVSEPGAANGKSMSSWYRVRFEPLRQNPNTEPG
jgi:DNA-binding MarR family transcriptional regulator